MGGGAADGRCARRGAGARRGAEGVWPVGDGEAALDEDTRKRRPIKVVVLGSAPLLIQRGLSESLAGRFEVVYLPHWSAQEMRAAFDWTVEQSIFYGGYPGAAPLAGDPGRWVRYVRDALIEPTLARDVLLLTRVDKPALLRRLFDLGCRYPGKSFPIPRWSASFRTRATPPRWRIISICWAVRGCWSGSQKVAGAAVRSRASSPKLQVLDTALLSAQSGYTFEETRADFEFWGRLVVSAVGAHLANAAAAGACELSYWRDRNREVDFVVRAGRRLTAIEVKSGRATGTLRGMEAFATAFKPQRMLLVGGDGIPVDEFLSRPVEQWIGP